LSRSKESTATASSRKAASPAASPPRPKPSSWSAKLLPQQVLARDFLIERLQDGGGAGLFSEQGTGKTFIALALLEKLRPANVLIVAPLTACDTAWADRIAGKSGFNTLPLPYRVLRTWDDFKKFNRRPLGKPKPEGFQGKAPRPRTSPAPSLGHDPAPRPLGLILLIHFQLLSKIIGRLSRNPQLWDLIIIDESQGLKARGSGWSRAARKLRHAPRRLVLSGTPIDKSPIDVYAQMRFIDHRVLGEDWGEFAEEYCYRGGWQGYVWKFKQHKLSQFLKAIAPYCYRLSKDFMQLPPLTIVPVPVPLLGEQARIYRAMDEDNIVTVSGHKFVADLEVTKRIKLEQITGGFLMDDAAIVSVGRAKARKLDTLLRRLKPPIVMFCKFLEELNMITDIAGGNHFDSVSSLHGSVSKDARSVILRDFKEGKIDLLACQIRTGGVGVDMSAASTIIAYSMNNSMIDFEQFVSRLHRGGQTRPVTAYLLYAQDTEDERIIERIRVKRGNAFRVLRYLESK
jgi:hypothetical protein